MRRTKSFLTVLFLLLITCSYGQSLTNPETAIDKKCKDCLKQAKENEGMVKCVTASKASWEKEVENYYNLLLTVLKGAEKENFITDQINWKDFTDKQVDVMHSLYKSGEGKEKQVALATLEQELIKQRAVDLKTQYESISKQ